MRKTLAASVVILVALLFVVVPARAAASGQSGVLRSDLSIVANYPIGPPWWWGGLTGDITGMVTYQSDPEHTGWGSGSVWHFYEVFTVCVGESVTMFGCQAPKSYITGVDAGVYILQTGSGKWHFMATGWVTGASPDFANLVGYKYHENGWTTDPFDPVIVYGEGTAFFAPG